MSGSKHIMDLWQFDDLMCTHTHMHGSVVIVVSTQNGAGRLRVGIKQHKKKKKCYGALWDGLRGLQSKSLQNMHLCIAGSLLLLLLLLLLYLFMFC